MPAGRPPLPPLPTGIYGNAPGGQRIRPLDSRFRIFSIEIRGVTPPGGLCPDPFTFRARALAARTH